MKPMLAAVAALAALSLQPPACPAAPSLQDQKDGLPQMLEKSGFKYRKHNDSVWSIPFEGKSLGKSKVIISIGKNQEIIVIFVIIAKKAQLDSTPEMMEILLKANHKYDRVKVGIDDDGDAFVRCDTLPRIIDVEDLKAIVKQVRDSSDEVFASIKTFVK